MNKIISYLLSIAAAVAFAAAPAVSLAADAIVLSDSVTLKATIVKIDKKKREITLRGEDGTQEVVAVSDEVRNFDQIKKGDVLEVEYHRAAASALQKVGDTTSAGQTTEMQRAPAGAKPGMTAMTMSTIVATVLDVDTAGRLLTVKGPKGNVVTILVPADMKAFDTLKKGDKITAEYGEAVAVSVKTPEKKKK
jgi:hypothetical protein